MWRNGKELKKQLIYLEKLKEGIMKQINIIGENENAIIPTKVYPVAKVTPLQINGYPVIHLQYEGLLPHHLNNQKYQQAIRNYYHHATLSAFDYREYEGMFEEVVIFICQYFKDNIIRDLDNRNTKYIQDAIRQSGIIQDDSWDNVWNFNLGFFDDAKNHVQVYVVSRKESINFYEYLLKNHEKLKKTDNFIVKRDDFVKENKIDVMNLDEEYSEETEEKKYLYSVLFD